MISSNTKVCVGIGYPIYKSLGPVIHNSGIKAAGLDDDFIYISLNVEPNFLDNFINFARSSNIRAITVTLPHKEKVIPLLDEIDPIAQEIGSINTIVNENGKLKGYSTDWIGAIEPLKAVGELKGRKVAVIGAGGAAKAFVYGLSKEGADVTIYNRTIKKAHELAHKYACNFKNLDEIKQNFNAEIICNASSIGFSGSNQAELSPIPVEILNKDHVVFDAVYSPLKTKLLQQAESVGAKTILGTEMLLYQGYAQFEMYYQKPAPQEAMRNSLMEYLKNEN